MVGLKCFFASVEQDYEKTMQKCSVLCPGLRRSGSLLCSDDNIDSGDSQVGDRF
jgi:hypothetical protein